MRRRCVYVCVYIYAHTHTYIYVHIYKHTHTHTHTGALVCLFHEEQDSASPNGGMGGGYCRMVDFEGQVQSDALRGRGVSCSFVGLF